MTCVICDTNCGPLNGETKSWRCAGLLSRYRQVLNEARARYDSPGKRAARNLVVEVARVTCSTALDFYGGGQSAEALAAAGLHVTSAEVSRRLHAAQGWHARRGGFTAFAGRAERLSGPFDLVFADYTGGGSQKTRRSLRLLAPKASKWLAVTLAPDHQLDWTLIGPSAAATLPAWLNEATGLDLEYVGRYVRNANGQTMWIALLSRPARPRGHQQLSFLTIAREIQARNYWATPSFRQQFPHLVRHRQLGRTERQREQDLLRYERTREERRERSRTYYQANRDHLNALARERRQQNPEKSRAYQRQWRQRHPYTDEQKARQSEYRRAWYLANRGTVIEKARAYRAARRKPRIEKTHCPSGHSYSGENLIYDSQGYRQCRTCRREQSQRQASTEKYRARQRAYQRRRRGLLKVAA